MAASIPTVTAEQMARVDRIMIDDLGVDVLQLMEAAGLAVTEAIRRQLDGEVANKRVLLLAGSGGNGGDALVAARYLKTRGAHPKVILSKPAAELPEVTAHQHRLAQAFGVSISEMPEDEDSFAITTYDLIVDGVLGFSGRGDPRGTIAELIHFANSNPAPVLAIDVPSGLDATSGVPGDPSVRADATITLALPKSGFLNPKALAFSAEITVADIGVPASVLEAVGVTVLPTLFSRQSSLRWTADRS